MCKWLQALLLLYGNSIAKTQNFLFSFYMVNLLPEVQKNWLQPMNSIMQQHQSYTGRFANRKQNIILAPTKPIL